MINVDKILGMFIGHAIKKEKKITKKTKKEKNTPSHSLYLVIIPNTAVRTT